MSKVIGHQNTNIKFPEKRPKTSARVLTKQEHLTFLLNKEQEKKDREALKEKRKLEHEQKKEEKKLEQEKRMQEREKKGLSC